MEKKEEKWLTKLAASGIRRQRELNNMTQAELAEQLSLEPETVSCIECGLSNVTFKNLEKLSVLFSCPADTFFHDSENTEVQEIFKTIESALGSLEPKVQLAIITYLMSLPDIHIKDIPN